MTDMMGNGTSSMAERHRAHHDRGTATGDDMGGRHADHRGAGGDMMGGSGHMGDQGDEQGGDMMGGSGHMGDLTGSLD